MILLEYYHENIASNISQVLTCKAIFSMPGIKMAVLSEYRQRSVIDVRSASRSYSSNRCTQQFRLPASRWLVLIRGAAAFMSIIMEDRHMQASMLIFSRDRKLIHEKEIITHTVHQKGRNSYN